MPLCTIIISINTCMLCLDCLSLEVEACSPVAHLIVSTKYNSMYKCQYIFHLFELVNMHACIFNVRRPCDWIAHSSLGDVRIHIMKKFSVRRDQGFLKGVRALSAFIQAMPYNIRPCISVARLRSHQLSGGLSQIAAYVLRAPVIDKWCTGILTHTKTPHIC